MSINFAYGQYVKERSFHSFRLKKEKGKYNNILLLKMVSVTIISILFFNNLVKYVILIMNKE